MKNNRKLDSQYFRSDFFTLEDCINEHTETVDFYNSMQPNEGTNVIFSFHIPYDRFLSYVNNMGEDDAVQISLYHQQVIRSIGEFCENREQIYSILLSYIFSVGEMKESLIQFAEPNIGIRAYINENDIYPLVEVISAFDNQNLIIQ